MFSVRAAGSGESVAMESVAGGSGGGGEEEERLVGGQPRTQIVQATKRSSFFGKFKTAVSVAQEGETQKGKMPEGSLVPESATVRWRGDGDEEALVDGEPELGGQARVPAKRPTWGLEAPPAYSSLPLENREHEDDLQNGTGR